MQLSNGLLQYDFEKRELLITSRDLFNIEVEIMEQEVIDPSHEILAVVADIAIS